MSSQSAGPMILTGLDSCCRKVLQSPILRMHSWTVREGGLGHHTWECLHAHPAMSRFHVDFLALFIVKFRDSLSTAAAAP